MSMQSDIEMLSIQTMEVYAAKNKISTEEAQELFHKHQVFEKIMIQHEYLHQVSFDEVMEFVDKTINEAGKELVLYHGSTHDFEKILLEKSHDKRDFGKGFYTTLIEQQAKEWAYRLSLREQQNKYFVYRYVFYESDTLKIKRFDSLNREWLEFIKENRSRGGVQHEFDVVIGPVADDNTMETVQLYMAGILNPEEAVNRLKYNKVNNQVSFHTKKALNCLKRVGRSVYE